MKRLLSNSYIFTGFRNIFRKCCIIYTVYFKNYENSFKAQIVINVLSEIANS